ncbi:hypothetical protein MTO96_030713 [Rhipicephalus appendiculatus]
MLPARHKLFQQTVPRSNIRTSCKDLLVTERCQYKLQNVGSETCWYWKVTSKLHAKACGYRDIAGKNSLTPARHPAGPADCRYGQYSQLYPDRRGVPVPNAYCHRAFRDCAPGRCFVQSPGYPGIYPRNLLCKYRISVRRNLVGLDLAAFDVDGLRCDNLLMCFPRPVTRDPELCPYDYVKVREIINEET